MTIDTEIPHATIDEAVSSLDLRTKIRLLSGARMFSLHGDTSIGLEEIVMSDGPTGVRGEAVVGGRPSCLLPNATLIAQTWNRNVLAEVGELLAEEAQDQQTHIVLGPTINLHRTPLGGRLFECFSEDPYLTGVLAAAYVSALQAKGIGASPKHFLANESETQRTTVDCVVDERSLRELYLLPFEIVEQDATPWTVMASYNGVNGTTATEHDELINGVLKSEWGFDGLVMSDWFATKRAAESANAGLDLVMPGPDTVWDRGLEKAVRAGHVSEATIDDHVRRLLTLAARVGAFPTARSWPKDIARPDSDKRREQLRRIAAEGMTVLKNDGGVLPLTPGTGTVAVIGRHATDTVAQGGGSARVRPPHVVSIAEGLESALGTDSVTLVDGVETRTRLMAVPPSMVRDPESGEQGIRVRAFDEAGELLESRHIEVAELEVAEDGWLAGAHRIELSADVALPAPARMRVGVIGPGDWTVATSGHTESFTITPHQGPGGGLHRPKSHASVVPLEAGARITATTGHHYEMRIIGLVVTSAPRSSAAAISEAVEAAAGADTAVVVVGNTQEQETEGQDQKTLALPGDQDALVAAVAAVARRTVVIVNAASPVLMPWIDDVDAVLFAGLPGQEAGDAVAAALTGAIEPAGRLVTTFPRHDGEGPAWDPNPTAGRLSYSEGTAIGYRGWHRDQADPLFWFGHGLGYASWDYQEARVHQMEGTIVRGVEVTLTNIGTRHGRETVQVYRVPRDPADPVRLIGWSQVSLGPGEHDTVQVTCDHRPQRVWDPAERRWHQLPGGTIVIARGLGDVRASLPVDSGQEG
ncbi:MULTISPECIES: glycoside hydrolase family 3 C-terminal domain-containing protein [Arthrobacter]|uniref:Glycoside hydrolase family 3 protein n=1 Tax=Arthrobacter terricola TaxID=2547396 RepID=A0A4R5K6C8_9MICC|nr:MULTISPECIES: glycoside hydrolase family 3 C-terminal domain-containing protein [Arthrobacter]MBT8163596.1 glycoside hydrolase family 3 C-terminal domain-containing protein [Arthrobacter sp. GN70]TDF88537.1 glycoside hydrolase family 3 protein [Arthrobacter terricola]